jgi:hypothetical protein
MTSSFSTLTPNGRDSQIGVLGTASYLVRNCFCLTGRGGPGATRGQRSVLYVVAGVERCALVLAL